MCANSRRTAALLLALALLLFGPSRPSDRARAAANDASTLVISVTGFDAAPVTNGDSIAYNLWHPWNAGETDVFGVSLAGGEPYPIAADTGSQAVVALHGYDVLWSEFNDPYSYGALRGKNLATGQTFAVSPEVDPGYYASVFGDWQLDQQYATGGGEQTLRARNLRTGGAWLTLARFPADHEVSPYVDGDRVVWSDGIPMREIDAEHMQETWTIATLRFDETTPQTLFSGSAIYRFFAAGDTVSLYPESGSSLFWFTVADGHAALARWLYPAGQQELRALSTDPAVGRQALVTTTPIFLDPANESATIAGAALTGRYVLWQLSENVGGYPQYGLWAYDLLTNSTFLAVPAATNAEGYLQPFVGSPSIQHDLLLWQVRGLQDKFDSTVEIHAAPVAEMLPTARRASADVSIPGMRYFPETGHILATDTATYWAHGGGLPLFGYPLTDEFSQGGLTVQYLERQRFERHPENTGTPYTIELGRLGAEDAAARGLFDTPAFQPRRDAPGSDCAFFAVTGHGICGDFLVRWRAAGVDFGDAGVSERESLALFGYPLSEPFIDPTIGLTTQYFERAVFEDHPENAGTPYVVLLRRLGAERLVAYGW